MDDDVAGIFRQALPGGPARYTTLWLRTGLSSSCTTGASSATAVVSTPPAPVSGARCLELQPFTRVCPVVPCLPVHDRSTRMAMLRRRTRRVRTGTWVHYTSTHTVRLTRDSPVGNVTSGQVREEDAASEYGYTGTL